MPDAPTALVAFVAEHQPYGDLDGGRDDARVWIVCSAEPESFTPPMRLRKPLPRVTPRK
jgi:hypothetical protein